MPSIQEFFEAITAGNVARVQQMLAAQPSLLRAVNETGDTPILWAVYHQKDAVAAALLESRPSGLDIFEAAATGQADALQALLLDDASRINAYSHDGWTPLHLAAFFGHQDAVELLLAHGADVHAISEGQRFANANTPLHAATAGGRQAIVGLLLRADADPNAPDGDGHTSLHIAAAGGNPDIVQMLLDAGANPKASAEGKTPLAYAKERGHTEVVEMLQSGGL